MVNITTMTEEEFNQKFKEASAEENNEILIQDTRFCAPKALLNDASRLGDKADYLRRGSLIANGLQTMLDKKPVLPEEALKEAEGMIAVIDIYANSTTHPIHINEGKKLQEMVQKVILEAENLQAQFQHKKKGFFTSAASRKTYEEALAQVKSTENAALMFQEKHAEAKAKGECWLPKTEENTDYEAFQTLTQEIKTLKDMTETHTEAFGQSIFHSFLNAIKALLESNGMKIHQTISMRDQVRGLKEDIDEISPNKDTRKPLN